MTDKEFSELSWGDVVRHVSATQLLIVVGNYGGRITAIRSVDMTNPIEWELVGKSTIKWEIPNA